MKTIHLESTGWNFDSVPDPGVEILQTLTIQTDGSFSFTSYVYDHKEKTNVIKRQEQGIIDPKQCERLYDLLTNYTKTQEPTILSYIQPWTLTLKDENESHTYTGSMVGKVEAKGVELTEFIRALIPVSNIFAFNNTDRTDIGFGCYCVE